MADWQSLDPEAAREAEKYDNPIPSRELILQRLADRGEPAAREELAAEFGLYEEDQIEALRRRLRAMERDGQLIYTRRGTYAPVDKLDLICGRVSGHRDGFGFLIPMTAAKTCSSARRRCAWCSTATAAWPASRA
jgi:RNAse R (EC 3.1.-.-)